MKNKFKRVVAVIMAVCLLFVAVPPVKSNAAGYITPGMLFSFMSSLYGVYVQANQADNEMGAFETWLTKKVSDIKDNYSSAKEIIDAVKSGNMEKVVMSVALMTVTKEFLSERTADVGGISSGTAVGVYKSKAYIAPNYQNTALNIAFRDYFMSTTYFSKPTIFVSLEDGYFYAYRSNDSFSDYQYFYMYGNTVNSSKDIMLITYFDDGSLKSKSINYSVYKYSYNPVSSEFSLNRTYSVSTMKDTFDRIYVEYPMRYSDLTVSYSNMNTFLSNTSSLNVTDVDQIYTVTGGYQAGTIDKLSDKELSAAQLEAINSVVKTAVLDNTTTSEDDDTLVYAPDISIDLANALVQALADQGVITDETTGEDTGTTDKPVVVPTDPATFGIDLTNFFPFCIPFDLYDMLNVLCADPVAPSFDWEIMSPTGKKEKFTIDLSVFDSVAQVVRTVELLGFCVGLAFKTRDLIRG